MTKELNKLYSEKMDKHIASFKDNLTIIRAGRANPALVENITFEYYGTPTPIKNAATISAPEARLLQIQPWDAGVLRDIEKAIIGSELGITPSNDGKIIRLPFPALTEERRKDLVKDVKKKSEEAKVGIRNMRRDLMDDIKKLEKDGELTEDDRKSSEKEAQNLTDKYVKIIDEITKDKEAELLEV